MADRTLVVRLIGNSQSLERAFTRSSKSGEHFALTMRGVTRSTGGFARGFASGAGALSSFGGALALTSGSFFAGAGLVAGLKASVSAAGDFQRTMNVLQSVSGATAVQMRAVRKEATRLGADLSLPATSAVDAANAMTQLVKGGLSVAQALEAARGTLQLAAAAQTDVGSAADITARTLSAFALSGVKAGTVADALANAANAATGDISDFAIGLQQSATVAHQFGLSAEETVTALAELARAGLVGSDAGTSLRVMLSRLLPTSKAARTELRRLGINVHDAGNFLPLRDIIGQYSQALGKLSPAQRQQALQTIFGTDAQRAANIILGDGVKNYDELRAAVGRHGAAAKLAAAKQKGFKGALDGFNSALQTTEVNLGSQLLPVLTKYLHQSGAWLSDTENQKRLQHDFAAVLHDTGTVIRDVKGIIETIDRITGGFKETLELLVGIKLAPVVLGWLSSFDKLIGAESGVGLAGAASKSGLLLARLKALAAIGTITIVLSLVPKAKASTNPKAPSNNPVAKAFAGLPFVGNLFSQANRLVDKLAEVEGLTKPDPVKLKGITAAQAALKQTFAQAKLLNPNLTRKAFDLGQSVARAFLKGQESGVKQGTTVKGAADPITALTKLVPKGITASQRNTFFDNALTRQLDRVQDLGLKGQLAALGRISGLISQRIAVTKDITRKLNLEDKLLEVSRQAKVVRSELAKKVSDARAARQFGALGLGPTGSALVPNAKSLRKDLGKFADAVSGTFLDTSKTQSVLSKIRRVLAGGMGKLSQDVRSTIKGMLDDLNQQLKDNSNGPVTKFQKANTAKLLAGLGLDPAEVRAVRARLSQLGPGGTVPRSSPGSPAFAGGGGGRTLVVHTHTYIDGKQIAPTVTRHQQKTAKRNPGQRRGPHAGQ